MNTASNMVVFAKKNTLNSPEYEVMMTVSNNSTAISVIIVPPMLTTTGSSFVMFNRLAMGYETRVCVENMQANSSEAGMLKLKM